jgi:hypothetical protein
MPVGLTVGVTLAPPVGMEIVALAVEALAMDPVVPPTDAPPPVAELALPAPVLLVVDGAAMALEVIAALVGRLSAAAAVPPPPLVVAVVAEVVLEVDEVTTPELVTLALGWVT